MEGFGALLFLGVILAVGGAIGNFTSEHEVNIKSITTGQELCKQHEGLYMINSKRIGSSVHCKDGSEFSLESENER
jgi:hypothetical protein